MPPLEEEENESELEAESIGTHFESEADCDEILVLQSTGQSFRVPDERTRFLIAELDKAALAAVNGSDEETRS